MQPTKNLNTINRRHQAISDYFENIDNAEKIQKTLKDTVDLQKMATRIIKKPFPVLFLKIKQTLDIALNDFTIKTALDGLFGEQEQASLKALSQQINDTIEPEI